MIARESFPPLERSQHPTELACLGELGIQFMGVEREAEASDRNSGVRYYIRYLDPDGEPWKAEISLIEERQKIIKYLCLYRLGLEVMESNSISPGVTPP